MDIITKTINRCCTINKTKEETKYLLQYMINKNSRVILLLEEIEDHKGLLILKGLHNLLNQHFCTEFKDFIHHIQIKTIIKNS